jgi:hypothetical protein
VSARRPRQEGRGRVAGGSGCGGVVVYLSGDVGAVVEQNQLRGEFACVAVGRLLDDLFQGVSASACRRPGPG